MLGNFFCIFILLVSNAAFVNAIDETCKGGYYVFQDVAVLWKNTYESGDTNLISQQIVDMMIYKLFNQSEYQFFDEFGSEITRLTFIPFPATLLYAQYNSVHSYDWIKQYSDINDTLESQLNDATLPNFIHLNFSDISDGLSYFSDYIEPQRRTDVNNTVIIIAKSDIDVDESLQYKNQFQNDGIDIVVIGIGQYTNISNLSQLASKSNYFFNISNIFDDFEAEILARNLINILAECADSESATTLEVTTTTIKPTSTPTPTPTANYGKCYGIIFAGEMSVYIADSQKHDFFSIVKSILNNIGIINNFQFGITTFGTTIYKRLEFEDRASFSNTLNAMESGTLQNGTLPNLQKPLDDIYEAILGNPTQKITVFLMGENEGIRDPNAAHTAALKIAKTGTNVYVLDYSTGYISVSLWPYLTNNIPDRIINGTSKSVADIFAEIDKTLVKNVNNGNC